MTDLLPGPVPDPASDSEPATALVGQTLNHRYLLEGLIGAGGMGAVYKARDLHTDGQVAVKVLHRELANDADVFGRFRAEAAIVDRLQHRNITRVRDFHDPFAPHGDRSQPPYIVQEYLDGQNLQQRLKQRGKLPLPDVLELARQVGGALQAAHEQGVIHRDIKPANIFYVTETTAYGPTEVVKLLDFGIAKAQRFRGEGTRAHAILGTPNYMAPEAVMHGSGAVDGRADQWALALTLYEALSGHQAYPGDNLINVLSQIQGTYQPEPLAHLVEGLPVHVYSTIARAMNKDPAQRFSSMARLVQALDGQAPEPLLAAAPLPDVARRSGAPTIHADPDPLLRQVGKAGPDGPTVHAEQASVSAALAQLPLRAPPAMESTPGQAPNQRTTHPPGPVRWLWLLLGVCSSGIAIAAISLWMQRAAQPVAESRVPDLSGRSVIAPDLGWDAANTTATVPKDAGPGSSTGAVAASTGPANEQAAGGNPSSSVVESPDIPKTARHKAPRREPRKKGPAPQSEIASPSPDMGTKSEEPPQIPHAPANEAVPLIR